MSPRMIPTVENSSEEELPGFSVSRQELEEGKKDNHTFSVESRAGGKAD